MNLTLCFPSCTNIPLKGVSSRAASIVIAALLFVSPASVAQQGNERTSASPGDAVLAAYNAVKSKRSARARAILGSNVSPILYAGDDGADKKMADDFVRRYDQMHRVVIEPDQTAILYIGAGHWPMPIPVVKNSADPWYFDTERGMKKILYRQVGTNENYAMEVLHTLVDAQPEYGSETHDGGKTEHYALRFLSNEGKQNGLYWKTADNEAPSRAPRICSVPGTASQFRCHDPFVNQKGIVYEKDLGPTP